MRQVKFVLRASPSFPHSTYYLAHALTQQVGSGQNHGEIKSVIGIHLLDFELFDAPGQQNQAM